MVFSNSLITYSWIRLESHSLDDASTCMLIEAEIESLGHYRHLHTVHATDMSIMFLYLTCLTLSTHGELSWSESLCTCLACLLLKNSD